MSNGLKKTADGDQAWADLIEQCADEVARNASAPTEAEIRTLRALLTEPANTRKTA